MRYRVLAGFAAVIGSALILGIGFRVAQSHGAGTVSPPPPPAGCAAAIPDLALLESDMTLPSEEHPKGVASSKDYGARPRLNMGVNPGRFSAIEGWGQLYQSQDGESIPGAAAEFKDIRVYILAKSTGRWTLVQSSADVDGAAYREDFAGSEHIDVPTYHAADGGVIATLTPGRNFHFWPTTGRKAIDPQDIAGVYVALKARLVPDPASRTPGDDWRNARFVLSVGADYWLNTTAKWDHMKTNNDVGIGRFKRVRPCWGVFTMTTMSPVALRANPPPFQ